MDNTEGFAQLGPAEVDRPALAEQGMPLARMVDELAASLDSESAAGAPDDGWRVLRRYPNGPVLIGAPSSADGNTWRIAQVDSSAEPVVRVHPESLKLRPSQAERRSGLDLSWPAVADRGDGTYVVDVVNEGASTWFADGDSFYAVGVLTKPGVSDFSFGWAALAQEQAVPLGPGDYARVPVKIDQSAWVNLEPGMYDLNAVLVDLGLRSGVPLPVKLTAEMIVQRSARNRRLEPSGAEQRGMLDSRIAMIEAQIAAGSSLASLVEILATAESDSTSLERISVLLNCDSSTAQSVLHMPVSELRPGRADSLREQLAELHLRRNAL